MLRVAFLASCLVAGASAQTFQSDKPVSAETRSFDADSPAADDYEPIADQVTMTNKRCPDDLTITLKWTAAADLDLYVETPDMCLIYYVNRLSKSGGVLVEDTIPGTCDEGEYSEVVRFGNGVANGGIYYILASYYSDGGCGTGPVDIEVTVEAGGSLAETYESTLAEPNFGASPEFVAYVLGYSSGCKRRRHSGKCVCYGAKTVSERGQCVSLDSLLGDGATPPV